MKELTMVQWINVNWINRSVYSSASIFCIVRKNWAHTPSASASYSRQAGWLAGWLAGRQNIDGFQNF